MAQFFSILLVALWLVAGCGGDDKPKKGTFFEGCTASEDCEAGLTCQGPAGKKVCNVYCQGNNSKCTQYDANSECMADGYCHIYCETTTGCLKYGLECNLEMNACQ